jgi:hypothetical protein
MCGAPGPFVRWKASIGINEPLEARQEGSPAGSARLPRVVGRVQPKRSDAAAQRALGGIEAGRRLVVAARSGHCKASSVSSAPP